MQLGMIGLGRMGGNMARRLMKAGHSCVVYDRAAAAVEGLVKDGAVGSASIDEFVSKLTKPRAAWVMLPAGEITETAITAIAARMEPGDIIIDGGNTKYTDDVRRAKDLLHKGVHYVDVGTSGGIWGLDRGYCLMIGGPPDVFKQLEPMFATLAPGKGDIPPTPHREGHNPTSEQGYLLCGPAGAGHFVKMVHNGIEYGLMQAYAEGFDIMRGAAAAERSPELQFTLPVDEIAEVWRRGSVVSSWLLDLTATALAEDRELSNYTGHVEDSGEGRWTIMSAIESSVPAVVLSAALYARFRSREQHTFADKMLSAMRAGFGGHVETK
jgi:6-phosphogluconate dehydrogenase